MSIQVVDHGEVTTESQIPRLTAEEITQYAKDHHSGHIFGSWQIRDGDSGLLPSIFMVLVFLDDITTKTLLNAQAVYCMEYLDKSANMNINGYPVFFSCRFVVKEDVEAILAKCRKIDELLKSI